MKPSFSFDDAVKELENFLVECGEGHPSPQHRAIDLISRKTWDGAVTALKALKLLAAAPSPPSAQAERKEPTWCAHIGQFLSECRNWQQISSETNEYDPSMIGGTERCRDCGVIRHFSRSVSYAQAEAVGVECWTLTPERAAAAEEILREVKLWAGKPAGLMVSTLAALTDIAHGSESSALRLAPSAKVEGAKLRDRLSLLEDEIACGEMSGAAVLTRVRSWFDLSAITPAAPPAGRQSVEGERAEFEAWFESERRGEMWPTMFACWLARASRGGS